MIQQEQLLGWQCVQCKSDNKYYHVKCIHCKQMKDNFQQEMNQNDITDIDNIGMIDFHQIGEQLIFHVAEYQNKQLKEYQNSQIIQISLIDIQQGNSQDFLLLLQWLCNNIYVFEDLEKAQAFHQWAQIYQNNKIQKIILLNTIYPYKLGHKLGKKRRKEGKDYIFIDHFITKALAKNYKFQSNMLLTYEFPIPEIEQLYQGFDNLVILDFEATCDNDSNIINSENQEIIEFPAQIYNIKEGKVIKQFWYYIKPTQNPQLTDFCKELTNITQDQVDKGKYLQDALDEYNQFIQGMDRSCVVTCGNFDLRLLKREATRKKLIVPQQLKYYINLKEGNHYQIQVVFPKQLRIPQMKRDPDMVTMLNLCKLKLEGHHHSGIDDVRNLTRVVEFIIKKHNFKFDERMVQCLDY